MPSSPSRSFSLPVFSAVLAASATFSKAEVLFPPFVSASSTEFSAAYAAANVFDNNSTDFASQGAGADTFLEFQFAEPTAFDKIVVLNRDSPAGGDWIADFSLTFDDGPSVQVSRVAKRGVSEMHEIGSVTATKVLLEVDSTGIGGATNTGAMEVFFLKTPAGSVRVDSVAVSGSATPFNGDYAASNAVDGLVGRSSAPGLTPEYASLSMGADAYIDFDLGAVVPVTGFDWFDRITAADRVIAFDMIFSANDVFGDGDDVLMPFDNSASAIGVSGTFPPVSARYARYDVTAMSGAANANTGLSEIVFYRSGAAVPVAPQIAVPPAAAVKFASETHTFTVSATGSGPLAYQWKKGGQPIPDQNGVTLVLTNLQASDAADYSVTVTNSVGDVTSAAASLTVDTTPGNPAAGRMVWLKLDETAGLDAADAAGGDNAGVLENFAADHTQWTAGRSGGALSFNPFGPEGNVVTVADPGSFDFSTTGVFSASCWVKAPAGLAQTGGAAILCKGPGAGGEQFCLDIFGGGYRFYTRDTAVPSGIAIINTAIQPNGEWQHLAIVFARAGGRQQLYVNGELAGSAQPTVTTLSNADPISIGARRTNGLPETGYDLAFQGLIDDVSIYGRVLSPADILAVSPFIKTPPAGSRVFGGDTHTFSVTAAGAQPISYQWRKNGTPLNGETGAALVLDYVVAGDAADYSVTLTNAAGSITTTPVTLVVEAAVPDLTRGLVAHLKFDETTGFTAADSSGANHPGALESFADDNAQWQPGQVGGAIAFSAANPDSTEVVNIIDSGDLDFTANAAFSASCWVKAAPGAAQEPGAGVLTKGFGGGGEQFCLDLQPAGYRFYVWNGGTPNTPTVLQTNVAPSGEWQFLTTVLNRAANRMKLYVDGVEAGSVAPPQTLLFNADPISIGARTPNAATPEYTLNFQGLVDDVHIYDRDISPAEIGLLMAGVPVVDGPPLTITRNGANFEISWPTGVTGWTLEESASLQALTWTVSTGVVNNRLTIAAQAGRKFYRLRQD